MNVACKRIISIRVIILVTWVQYPTHLILFHFLFYLYFFFFFFFFFFTLENFKEVLSATTIHKTVPFDFNSSFVKQYFGQDRTACLDYFEFSQLLQVHTYTLCGLMSRGLPCVMISWACHFHTVCDLMIRDLPCMLNWLGSHPVCGLLMIRDLPYVLKGIDLVVTGMCNLWFGFAGPALISCCSC